MRDWETDVENSPMTPTGKKSQEQENDMDEKRKLESELQGWKDRAKNYEDEIERLKAALGPSFVSRKYGAGIRRQIRYLEGRKVISSP